MAIIDKKVIFMTILYIVLLVMMFIYSAIIIYQGEREDKSMSFSFFGFAILISLLCIVSIVKAESKSSLVKVSMGLSTLLLFAFLISSIVLSKPDSDKKLQYITYINMGIMFIVNLYATVMLIGKPVVQPIFDTSVA